MDERDLIRHLQEGGEELWQPATPPPLDPSITNVDNDAEATAPASSRRGWFGLRRPARGVVLRPWMVGGGALASVAVGLALGAALFGGSDAPAPAVVASGPPATSGAVPAAQVQLARFGDGPAPTTAAAVASLFTASDGKTMQVSVKNLPVPPHGTFYELWAIGKGSKMVSLGNVSVGPDGTGTTEVPVPVSLRRYPILDISLEPADGDPTHSGHSVLRSGTA